MFQCQRGPGGVIELFATKGTMTMAREVAPPAEMTECQIDDALDNWLAWTRYGSVWRK